MNMPEPSTALSRALDVAAEVVERRSSIPILDCLIMSSDGKNLTIETTDLDVMARITIERVGGPKFSAAPNFAAVREIVSYLGNEATFDFNPVTSRLAVGAPDEIHDAFLLSCLDVDEAPKVQGDEAVASFSIPADELFTHLEAVAPTMSHEETRFYLNGVCVEERGEDMRFVTTDGHRLTIRRRPLPEGVSGLPSSIIPRKAVKATLVALRQVLGLDVDADVSIGRTKVDIEIGSTLIRAKLIDGSFPDYVRVVPLLTNGTLDVDARKLARLIGGALAIHRGDKTPTVVFDFKARTIRAASSRDADFVVAMPGTIAGTPPDVIGFNAMYLERTLGGFGERLARLSFGDAASPLLITAEECPTTAVLMPMRV